MESEFPSNSSSRQRAEKVEKPEPKKVEKVVQGEVIRRKKPLGKTVKEFFFGGDNARATLSFVLMDVLLPAGKDAIADSVSQGIERMIFGEARSASRRTGMRPRGGSSNSFTNYNYRSSSSMGRDNRRDEPRNQMSHKARSSHDFDEVILPTRVEAEEVIDRLFDLVSQFEMASVSDLYELLGISANFTDQKYGWTDLRGAGVAGSGQRARVAGRQLPQRHSQHHLALTHLDGILDGILERSKG